MVENKLKQESNYSIFAWILFSFLFVYLFLRAWFVEPLHDEVATFFHYVETGLIWGDRALLDANNHLVNSYLSHWLFLIFGADFFWLRLPNVLSFTIFFWAIYQLVKPIKTILFRGITLVALTGIPFILDYFAYTRGYGISLAFFLATLVFLFRFSKSHSTKHLAIAYFFIIIAVYSNLTYLVSAILAILFVLIHQLLAWQELSWRKQTALILLHGTLIYLIYPAILFAEKLKEGGALYYGSLDGFWEVTGKTLSENTLFLDDNWFKWILLLVGVLLIFTLITLWTKTGTKPFFKKHETLLAWFLFGHIAVILCLAHFRDVNYPEDRVGMYLIPLSILLFAHVINNWKWSANGIYFLLVFPVLFIPRINLSTSIFSPDDRMSDEFYADVINEINEKSTISVYPLMRFSWALQNRKQKIQSTVSDYKVFNKAAELVLTKDILKLNISDLVDYDTISRDTKSTYIAYKRKRPFIKTVLFDSAFNISETNAEFISFGNFFIPDSLRSKKLQIHVHGDTHTSESFTFSSIVYSTFDENQNSVVYENWNQRWSQGLKKDFYMNFNYPIDTFQLNEKEVRVYLWNMYREKISIKNGKFEIILLE